MSLARKMRNVSRAYIKGKTLTIQVRKKVSVRNKVTGISSNVGEMRIWNVQKEKGWKVLGDMMDGEIEAHLMLHVLKRPKSS